MEESVSVEEIRELALRYIDKSECCEIARPNELFALFIRQLPPDKKNGDEWFFICYGMLLDYTTDRNEKPFGKWITMKYISFDSFPPRPASIRLQPPHIAKGYFQNFDRTSETKIVAGISTDTNKQSKEDESEAEILQFPGTK